MEGSRRSVDDLLGAIETAPTFGMNARELILQASRRIAAQEGTDPGSNSHLRKASSRQRTGLLEMFRRAPELLQAVPRADRPMVPFKAIQRSKVPRITRQAVLDRLAGQHLALLLHRQGKAASCSELAGLGEGLPQALQAAVEHEEDIYQLGKASKSVYLNFAARVNADTEEIKPSSKTSTEAHTASIDPAQPGDPQSIPSCTDEDITDSIRSLTGQEQPRKRQKVSPPAALVETDVNWDSTAPAEQSKDKQGGAVARGFDAGNGKSAEEAGAEGVKVDNLGGSAEPLQKLRLEDQVSTSSIDQLCPEGPQASRHWERPGVGSESSTAAALEEYSPSRHGGESPPRWTPEEAPTVHEKMPSQPPGDPKVTAALVAFLKAHLEPLYQAKVIDRAVFKAVMHKTVAKVMHSHSSSKDATFLIREGPKIHKLLMLYVEKLSSS